VTPRKRLGYMRLDMLKLIFERNSGTVYAAARSQHAKALCA